MIPQRAEFRPGMTPVTDDTALRHSAVWACLNLRASLVSTTPLDVFRRVGGVQVETPKPPVLLLPGGAGCGLPEWLFSSQFEIDRTGNVFGLITKRDGSGLPAEIELQPSAGVTVLGKGPQITGYRIGGKVYDNPRDVWHEKGATIPGIAVGLSPVSYAAMSIGGYLAAQQFANDWFVAGPHPKGVLKHTKQEQLSPGVSAETKARFKQSTANGDIFVTGASWEYTPEAQASGGAVFLDEMKYGVVDVCRFFGVPADMVDGGVSGSSVTYANVTQRNLQFLIMHMGTAFARREWAFSNLMLAQPRYVKFATDALLRMDPQTRTTMLGQQVRDRLIAPSEAREIDNREPFTPDQMAEFDRLFGSPNRTVPTTTGAPL
jgi:HK97 family phage portal protein